MSPPFSPGLSVTAAYSLRPDLRPSDSGLGSIEVVVYRPGWVPYVRTRTRRVVPSRDSGSGSGEVTYALESVQ